LINCDQQPLVSMGDHLDVTVEVAKFAVVNACFCHRETVANCRTLTDLQRW